MTSDIKVALKHSQITHEATSDRVLAVVLADVSRLPRTPLRHGPFESLTHIFK